MEKDRSHGRFAVKKRDIVLSAFLAVSISVALKESDTSGKMPYKEPVYPESMFSPVIIDNNIKINEPYSIQEPEVSISPSPKPSLSPEQARNEKIQQELDKINGIVDANPGMFNEKTKDDINMYYPIYKAAGDKYNVDWFLLWIVHEAETGASGSKIAFNGGSAPYFGGMQRNPQVWPQYYVDEAYIGLEFLDSVKTKNQTDAKEITAAAKELGTNINQYMDLGKNRAVLNALILYSADGPAKLRFKLYENYREVFNSSVGFVINDNVNGY